MNRTYQEADILFLHVTRSSAHLLDLNKNLIKAAGTLIAFFTLQSCSVLKADVGVTLTVKGMNILHLLSSTFPRNQQVLLSSALLVTR